MHSNRRSPAGRARNMKRMPVPQGDPVLHLTAPTTFTVVITRGGNTPTISTPVTTQTPPPSPPPPPPPTSTSSSTTLPVIPPSTSNSPPAPSISVASTSSNSASSNRPSVADSAAIGTRSLPAGAIVGIVIGVVAVILVAAFLLIRNRYVRSRLSRRTEWISRPVMASTGMPQTIGSFQPAPRSGYARQSLAPGEISPGVAFANAQSRALAGTGRAPPIPPPPTSYNNPAPGDISPLSMPAALPNNGATVKFTFIPSLPDELSISNGEVVRVVQEYDDGWALCVNSRDVQGMVPLECLDRGGSQGAPSISDYRTSRRESSLGMMNSRR